MYRALFRLVIRHMDPERAHGLAFTVIRMLGWPVVRAVTRALTKPDPALTVNALGRQFDSPFGVAAGFDKEGLAIAGLGALGFSHVEVGTLTAIAQPGNPRPRLFRLIPDRAVINRMGFNNHGAAAAAHRVQAARARKQRPVIGVNIGKSRVVEVADATADYLESTRLLAPSADYLVVNVSSPNTPGLRGLQELELLEPLLRAVAEAAASVPVLVKIAPDLEDAAVRKIAELGSIGAARPDRDQHHAVAREPAQRSRNGRSCRRGRTLRRAVGGSFDRGVAAGSCRRARRFLCHFGRRDRNRCRR
jgi:dihydroorotate dehydrogenase